MLVLVLKLLVIVWREHMIGWKQMILLSLVMNFLNQKNAIILTSKETTLIL